MTRKLVALAFAAALALSACGGDDDDDTAADPTPTADDTPTTSAPAEPDVVNVGYIPILDVAPLYLGEAQGFFADHSIVLDLTPAAGGAAIVPGVDAGQFHFGFSNVTSLLIAQDAGLGIKIVSNGNNSTGIPGEDFGGVVVKEDSPIQTAADLAGVSVATNTLQNIVPPVVRQSVRADGGDPDAVNFVELPFPDMPPALDAGEVDAVFVVEPFLTQTIEAGGRVVAWSFAEAAPSLTVAVWFTSTDLAESNPDLVQRFTEAMQESLAYADANPDEARAVIATYTQIDPAVIDQLTLPKWPADVDRESLEIMAELALMDGMISNEPDLDALLS